MQINMSATTTNVDGHEFNPKNHHDRKNITAMVMAALAKQKG